MATLNSDEPMPLAEARRVIQDLAVWASPEWVGLTDAAGRPAAVTVRAPFALPRLPRSAMDGYALSSAALPPSPAGHLSVRLEVVGELGPAEWRDLVVPPGACVAVATGTSLPPGTDAVVPWEWTRREGTDVVINHRPASGENVVAPGELSAAGQVLVLAGTPVDGRHLAALAAYGQTGLWVRRRLRVVLVETGDEVVEVGRPLPRGRVYNSSGPALMAELGSWGADVTDLGLHPDRPAVLTDALGLALGLLPDVVITTGGVSVGGHDLVPDTCRSLGVDTLFWRVQMKPGKAVYLGRADATLVFGLSGNPHVALASYYVLVRPALARLAGLNQTGSHLGRLARDWSGTVKHGVSLVWAGRDADGAYFDLGHVPVLDALVRAEALLLLPRRPQPYQAGDLVEVVDIDQGHSRVRAAGTDHG